MTDTPITWIDKKVLLLLREGLFARFGGAHGPVDTGKLTTALTRPKDYKAYGEARGAPVELFSLAAVYGYNIATLKPFADNNARLALLAIGLFLQMNGTRFAPDKTDAVRTLRTLVNGSLTQQALAQWIQNNVEEKAEKKAA